MHYRDALTACLPPVSYDRAGVEVLREFTALGDLLEEAEASARQVVVEHQPDKAALGLDDWERNHGLPDEALGGDAATTEARRANLIARITAKGNLSRSHLVELAGVVGFPGASITEIDQLTCEDPSDEAVCDDSWIGVWRMDAPGGPGNQLLLRRLMARRKPAHTIVFFNFAAL